MGSSVKKMGGWPNKNYPEKEGNQLKEAQFPGDLQKKGTL